MADLKKMSPDDQVNWIFRGFFPDWEAGKWFGVEELMYFEARSNLEVRTKYLLNVGADPEKLSVVYKEIARGKEFVETGNILVLIKGIERFYDEAIDHLER